MPKKTKKKKRVKSKRCNCLSQVNKKLDEKHYQVVFSFTINGDVYPVLEVEKIDGRPRAKAPLVVCAFCPFCGRKLP